MSEKTNLILLLQGLIFFMLSQAAWSESKEELPPPFKVASPSSRLIQKYTGMTWLAERSLELGGSLAARVMLGGKPKIKIQAYSLTDCLSGKFKLVSADLKDCSYKNVPLGDIKLKTSTPLQFRIFKSKQNLAGVAAPVMVAVQADIDEKDLSKALESPFVSSQLNFLRLQLPGLGDQHLQVLEPKVKIENGEVKINTWLITANAPKETGVLVDISAKPYLDAQRFIMLKDTQVSAKDIVEPEEFSKFSQDLLNPLLDVAKFDRKTHAFRLSEVKLDEQKVHFEAKLLLVPRPVQQAALPPASK